MLLKKLNSKLNSKLFSTFFTINPQQITVFFHVYVLLVTAMIYVYFKPFVPNAPFLYPLKTPENRKVF